MSDSTISPGASTAAWRAFREDAAELVMAALVGVNGHLVLSLDSRKDVIVHAAHLAVQAARPLWAALEECPGKPGYENLRRTIAIRCLAGIVAGQPGLHVATGDTRRAVLDQATRAAVLAADAVIAELLGEPA